jgi:hypothetical protein
VKEVFDKLAADLHCAWARYRAAFGEDPHGTERQLRALLEFMPKEEAAPRLAPRAPNTRFPGAKKFVTDALHAMGQVAPPLLVEEVALKVCEQFQFLDGKTEREFQCGYADCELNTTATRPSALASRSRTRKV